MRPYARREDGALLMVDDMSGENPAAEIVSPDGTWATTVQAALARGEWVPVDEQDEQEQELADRHRVALAGVASRLRAFHLPGKHPQKNHGDGGGGGVDVIPGDKLKLAGRIALKPGEKLVASQRIRTRSDADGWDLMVAEVDTPNGRQVRLGIIYPDDSKHWTAGPDPKRAKRIAELDAEIDKLESDPDLSDSEYERLEELQSERSELLDFDKGDVNRTAFVEPASVAKMRTDIGAGIERAKDWSKAWRLLSQEYDDVQDDGDLSAQEREDRLAQIEERFNALGDSDQYFLEGSIPGGTDGDLHYLVGGTDDGEGGWKIQLGIKPPDAKDDWYIGSDDAGAQFEGSDVKKLLKALDDLSDD